VPDEPEMPEDERTCINMTKHRFRVREIGREPFDVCQKCGVRVKSEFCPRCQDANIEIIVPAMDEHGTLAPYCWFRCLECEKVWFRRQRGE